MILKLWKNTKWLVIKDTQIGSLSYKMSRLILNQSRVNSALHYIHKSNLFFQHIDFLQYIGYRFNNEDFSYLGNNDFIMIGSSVQIGPIDSYLLEVNNNTGEVFAIEVMDKRSVKLVDSIEELLVNMEGY